MERQPGDGQAPLPALRRGGRGTQQPFHPGPRTGCRPALPRSPRRLARVESPLARINPVCELEVAGGVDLKSIGPCAVGGANGSVAGTAGFGSPNGPRAAVGELAAAALEVRRKG